MSGANIQSSNHVFNYTAEWSFTKWTSYLIGDQKDPNERSIVDIIDGSPNTNNIILKANGIMKMKVGKNIQHFSLRVRRFNNLDDKGMPCPGHFITLSDGTKIPEINQGSFITYSGKWYVIELTYTIARSSSTEDQRGVGDVCYQDVIPALVFMTVVGAITAQC